MKKQIVITINFDDSAQTEAVSDWVLDTLHQVWVDIAFGGVYGVEGTLYAPYVNDQGDQPAIGTVEVKPC